MSGPVSTSVLRAMVGKARDEANPPDVVMVRAAPRWEGEAVLDTEGGRIRVVPCVSALAVRDVLSHWSGGSNGEVLVILTDRPGDDLGEEVLARVWRHRVNRAYGWEAAKSLFRVDRLDPALADARWLIDRLVDVAPARGYPPPVSGFLDADTAWRTFLRHGLRIETDQPTLQDLLRWGSTDTARSAVTNNPEPVRERITERMEKEVGPVARHLMRLVAARRRADVVPLGLLADVLWGHGSAQDRTIHTARIRFEGPLGSKGLGAAAARAWGDAATKLVRTMADRNGNDVVMGWLTRAEALLTELDAMDLAVVSDVLPWAFSKRLMRAGQVLSEALAHPEDDQLQTLREATASVQQHLQAETDEEADRVRRLIMAERLVRRMAVTRSGSETDLEEAATAFVSDGAWLDAAREAIGHGETVSSLADAYGSLVKRIDDERADRDRTFARAFAAWSKVLPTDSTPILPIERVLGELVAPVARRAPVLFLVLDGLSYPESTRLFTDLRRRGWTEQGPDGRPLPQVVAAIPTVTTVSRASLLTGKLQQGGQKAEREGFEGHAELRDASSGVSPRLFHKKDLKIQQGRIAPEVRDAISDLSIRVVGAVVNAVDDHLDKGSQLRLADGLRALRPLQPLLDAAVEAGRAVILASDHGHVLENGSSVKIFSGSGERWRPAAKPPEDDEVLVEGPRVVLGGGRIVAPAVETIRYMPAEKRGYHGGLTPQEVLCPLIVLTSGGMKLDGWEQLPARKPAWWEVEFKPVDIDVPRRVPAAEPQVSPEGQGLLFTEEGEAAAAPVQVAGWIDELLESEIFAERREAAGRMALQDDDVTMFLSILDQLKGVAPAARMSDATGLPTSRLRSKLEALRRMLNYDGVGVLTVEPDGTARLNREQLAMQFEIEL